MRQKIDTKKHNKNKYLTFPDGITQVIDFIKFFGLSYVSYTHDPPHPCTLHVLDSCIILGYGIVNQSAATYSS